MTEYVGFDVSKEETAFCLKDVEGKILARGRVATDPQALFEALKAHCLCPEQTGTLSGWLARELGKLGIAVDVIDAVQASIHIHFNHDRHLDRRENFKQNSAAALAEWRPLAHENHDRFCQPDHAHLI